MKPINYKQQQSDILKCKKVSNKNLSKKKTQTVFHFLRY